MPAAVTTTVGVDSGGLFEAAQELSSRRPLMLPVWRLIQSTHHMQRVVSMRIAEVIRGIAAREETKVRERAAAREWCIDRRGGFTQEGSHLGNRMLPT
jgi:hypothetical protein